MNFDRYSGHFGGENKILIKPQSKKEEELPETLRNLLEENERRINMLVGHILCGVIIILFFSWMAGAISFQGTIRLWDHIVYLLMIAGNTAVTGICLSRKGRGSFIKTLLLTSIFLTGIGLSLYTIFRFTVYLVIPIITTAAYYDCGNVKKVTVSALILHILLLIMTVYLGIASGYLDISYLKVPDGTVLEIENGLINSLLRDGYLTLEFIWKVKLQEFVAGCCIICGFGIISYTIARQGMNMLKQSAEIEEQKHQLKLKEQDVKARIMLSQIQPHFLYNSLSAIMAIDGNPDETVDALYDFSKYLRKNLSVISGAANLPFSEELLHVKHYVNLEKLRFGDRLQVYYEIENEAFDLPPLSVQMLVENAIKHGITQKLDGGTVRIHSWKENGTSYVTVTDDGVGFDMSILEDDSGYVGISSVRDRLERTCGGSLILESYPGKGTTATIKVTGKGMEKSGDL